MPQFINTNTMSLNAQRNLNSSQNALATSLQRLSSGMRINSAKDDAAGLAISDRMTSQIRGLNMAVRNANDGISLAQTAEGALQESQNILQRMRELSIQSANGTNSTSDRDALQAEVSQLQEELTRIADTTTFNNKKLFDGSFGSQTFQVGSNANETISVSVADARASKLGISKLTFDGTVTGNVTALATAATANGVTLGTGTLQTSQGTSGALTYAAGSSAKDIATDINSVGGAIGVEATARNTATLSGFTGLVGTSETVAITLNGSAITTSLSQNGDLTNLANAINATSNASGVTATFTGSDRSAINLSTTDGRDIQFDTFSVSNVTSTVDLQGINAGSSTLAEGTTGVVAVGVVDVTTTDSAGITGATLNTTAAASAGASAALSSVASIDISGTTGAGAQAAIDVIDGALRTISDQRGDLGAIQNRFTSTISNLQNISENVSAARSRIQDADFAAETAQLSRNQILQQAGIAMLSQANASPQSVLSLLQ